MPASLLQSYSPNRTKTAARAAYLTLQQINVEHDEQRVQPLGLFKKIKKVFKKVVKGVANIFKGIGKALSSALKAVVKFVKKVFGKVFELVAKLVKNPIILILLIIAVVLLIFFFPAFLPALGNFLSSAFSSLGVVADLVSSTLQYVFGMVWNAIVYVADMISWAYNAFTSIMGDFFGWVYSWGSKLEWLFKIIGSMASVVGAVLSFLAENPLITAGLAAAIWGKKAIPFILAIGVGYLIIKSASSKRRE